MPFHIPKVSLSDLDFSVHAYTGGSRFLVYPLLSKTTEETQKICEQTEASSNDYRYKSHGRPHRILKVVPRSSGPGGSFRDLNACLDHYLQYHLGPVMQARRKKNDTEANIDVYPRGFIVMTAYNIDAIREGLYEGIEDGLCEWLDPCIMDDKRRIPLTKDSDSPSEDVGNHDAMAYIVHFDRVRRRWCVGAMRTSMDLLVWTLLELAEEENTFLGLMSEYGGNVIGNNDYIAAAKKLRIPGRNIPFSRWTFLAILTTDSLDSFELFPLMDPDFFELWPQEKALLAAEPYDIEFGTEEKDRIVVDLFLSLYYKNLIEQEAPGTKPLHPRIFTFCDHEDPETLGLLVCYVEWDGVMEGKDDEDLEEVARTAKCTWWKCDMETAITHMINLANREL